MADVKVNIIAEDNFTSTLGNFGNIMTGIKSVIDMVGDAFRFFKDYALEGLTAIESYERLGLALETLTAKELLATGEFKNMTDALSAASPRAEELLNWLQELAINSPFTLEGVANAFRLAQAYGFSADEAQRLTQAMIDFAAGTGASEQVMSQIALALGQIEAKGKLAGQEVLQLVNAGLPVTQILAEAFNVTTAEIEEMREKGLIPADEAIRAITEYLETNFAGAAERQAQSWAGLRGTFEDLKQMGLREFFGGLFDALQPLAVELSNWLQGPGLDQLRQWGTALGNFVQVGIDKIPDLIAYLSDLQITFETSGLTAVLDSLDEDLATAIDNYDWARLGDAFGEAILGAITSGVEGKLPEFVPALGRALSDFFRGAVGEVWFQNSGEDLAAAFLQVVIIQPFENMKEGAKQSIKNWWIGINNDVNSWLISTFRFDYQSIGGGIATGLAEGWNNAVMWLKNIFSLSIRDLINIVKDTLGISSPSTVFKEIGMNIILGLIDGINSMFSTLLTFIGIVVTKLLEPFKPILDLLGIDIGGGGATFDYTGTGAGGGVAGTSGTLTSGTNNYYNYYYGPVYFQGTGQTNGGVDCQSPNPALNALGSSLPAMGVI